MDSKNILGIILMIFGVMFTLGGVFGLLASPILILLGNYVAVAELAVAIFIGITMLIGGWFLFKS